MTEEEFIESRARELTDKILEMANMLAVEAVKTTAGQVARTDTVSSLLTDQILGLSMSKAWEEVEKPEEPIMPPNTSHGEGEVS